MLDLRERTWKFYSRGVTARTVALAAAQHGFYSVVPTKWKGNRYDKARGGKLPMPDLGAGEYLYGWLQDIGFYRSYAPNHMVAVSHQDLWYYFKTMQLEPETWETAALVQASRSFLAGYNMGRNDTSYSPMEIHEGVDDEEDDD